MTHLLPSPAANTPIQQVLVSDLYKDHRPGRTLYMDRALTSALLQTFIPHIQLAKAAVLCNAN